MNQIPNIEEVLENFNKAFPLSIDYPETPKTVETQARWHIEVENRTNRAKNIRHHQLIWLRSLLTTIHHQLQKAREEERERIIKLIDWRGKGFHSGSEVVEWIDEQLKTLSHSELDQDKV